MYKYHCYSDIDMHDTIIACSWITDIWMRLYVPLFFLIHVPPIYSYTNSLDNVITYIGIIVTWMLDTQLYHVYTSLLHIFTAPIYMHVLFLYSCHIDHRSYCMYYCCMYLPVFPLHKYVPLLILISTLLDTWVVDMRCVDSHI